MTELPDFTDFKDSLVAFVDILGFDKRVRNICNEEDFCEVGKLLYAMKSMAEGLSEAGNLLSDFKFTAISDSIIASVPFSNPICSVGMLQILHNIQYEMLGTDFKTLLRGYITRGLVYHNNGLIFGSGYSDAYKGERNSGSAPRIVLDPNIVKDAKRVIDGHQSKESFETVFDYLKEDACDGVYFIDYLKPVGGSLNLSREQTLKERRSIKTFINDSLARYEGEDAIKQKYQWLENYFYFSEKYFL